MSYKKTLVGDTIKFTWINSGVTMAPTMEVLTGSETAINTGSFTSSGDGHYYYLYTVTSEGFYRLKATGTANSKNYVRQKIIKGVIGGVD